MGEYDYKVTAAGRINIIGEHIDYCGGKVMPAALTLCNAVFVRPNGGRSINIRWTTSDKVVSLDFDKLESYKGIGLGSYQAGSALMWQRAGHKLVGCDMLQDCSVPFGSGLSSSAAIEVSTIVALAVAAGESYDPVEVALAARRAESEYSGVNCGIMDQYASACGKKGCAMLLDCKTLECRYIPLELGGYSFVIADCKKPHNLVESKYNERRAETDHALAVIRSRADIECLADIPPQKLGEFLPHLSPVESKRVRHVVEECERVRRAEKAIERGDMAALGALLNASHASLKNLYEVTGTELDCLVHAAQSSPFCVGSRMTGGGFGGCTLSLVEKGREEEFRSYVGRKYYDMTGYRVQFYESGAADGITVTKL